MGTKIEWTEATVNTIAGCTKYSEGCQNCYAERMHKRLTAMGQEKYKSPFEIVKGYNPLTELSKKITKNTKMCFVNSMSDTFHDDISDAYIDSLLQALGMYGNVNFQVLTKRAERIISFNYPENVWLGVTVENARHKERIEYLRQTDATVKFLSCEPLLGDLGDLDLTGINWVIVGGESGPNARPMHPDWVRNIQKQCEKQNVAFFFKQWGEWKLMFEREKEENCENPPGKDISKYCIEDKESLYYALTRDLPKKYTRTNFAGGYGFHGANVCYYMRTGKKKSGSMVDGVEYKQFPSGGSDEE